MGLPIHLKLAGEKGQADADAALEFCLKTISEILEEEQISLAQLYNADINIVLHPSYRNEACGEKTTEGKSDPPGGS